jgi:hypothetical protein
MATNDAIIAEMPTVIRGSVFDIETALNKARADQKAWDKAQEEEYIEIAKRQARADTAKEIFAKLDKAVWQQVEPSRLEEFLVQFSNAKDEEAALKVATAFSIIGLDAEKYEALKKKYKVD